jgi:hypothetical protein
LSKDLIDNILKASSEINKASRRGVGNYIITSKAVSDMIIGFSDKRYDRMDKIKKIFNV